MRLIRRNQGGSIINISLNKDDFRRMSDGIVVTLWASGDNLMSNLQCTSMSLETLQKAPFLEENLSKELKVKSFNTL